MVSAATEEIDGFQYAVLNLTSSMDFAVVEQFLRNNDKSKIVLQSNYTHYHDDGETIYLDGENIIIDLNGYTWTHNDYYCFDECRTLEIMDSSAGGTGKFDVVQIDFDAGSATRLIVRGGTISCGHIHGIYFCSRKGNECYIYGGKVDAAIAFAEKAQTTHLFNMQGGYVREIQRYKNVDSSDITLELSPYIVGDFTETTVSGTHFYSVARNLTHAAAAYITLGDYFAVSTTPYATGAYNYAYGLAWEITVGELVNLSVPSDKTYYLWARDKDGDYHRVDLHYLNGKWQ